MIRSSFRIATGALLCAGLASGCASSSDNAPKPGSEAAQVSIYSFDRQNYDNRPDRVLDRIETETHTRIALQTGTWEDAQLDVLMEMGSYPDILTIVDSEKTGRFNKWVKEGKIVPFSDELLEGLPNLQRVVRDPRFEELKIGGELYGLPLQDELPPGSVGQHVLIMRQDWLNRLGLKMPDTLEELHRTLIAFRDSDPDGNGKDDTYGLISNGLASIVRNLTGAWGIPVDARSTGFLRAGDGYEYWAIQPEVMEALQFVRSLYEDKLIQPSTLSAATNVQVRPTFIDGKVGALFDNANFEELRKKQDQLRRTSPDAELVELPALAGPTGKRGYSAGAGYWGYTVITDKAQDPVAAARVLDYLLSDEGNRLTLYGIPDVHYAERQGDLDFDLEERAKDVGFGSLHPDAAHELNWGIVSWSRMTDDDYLRFRESSVPGFTDAVKANLERINRYLNEPASFSLTTSKWISFKPTSDELVEEYFDAIVMGTLDAKTGFEKFRTKWLESGGAEAMREMSEAIAAKRP